MTSMNFDVTASDQASKEFLSIAAAAEKLEDRLRKLDKMTASPTVDLNIDPANRKLDQLKTRLDALKNVRTKVELDGADEARRDVTSLVVELRKLRDTRVKLDLATGTARTDIQKISSDLKSLRDAKVNITVSVSGEDKIDRLVKKLDLLRDAKVTVTVDVDDARLTPLAAKLKALPNKQTVKVDVDTDSGGGMSRLAKIATAIGALSPLAVASFGSSTAAVASFGGALATAVPVAVAGLGMLGGVMATVQVGTQGVGLAMGALAEGDMKKFKQALDSLSPEAQKFTLVLKDLYLQLKQSAGGVQDKLFDGLSASFKRMGEAEVPMLIRGMGGVATELNKAAKEAMGYLGSAEGIARQTSMWVSTRQVVANLAPAFTDVIAILSDLGEVGGKVLADVTDGVGGVTQRWREWIAEARNSGKLEEIMRGGVEVFTKLGSIIGNTGSILGSFYKAATTAGSDFLTTLDRGTEGIARYLKSAEGQNSLVTFFRESREAIDNLMPGLAAVGRGIMEAIRAFGETNGLAEFGASIGEILTQVGALLGPLGTLAGNTLKTLAQGAALASQLLLPIVTVLVDLLNACGPVGPAIIAMVIAFNQLQKVGGWVSGVRDQMTSLGQGVDRATTPLRRFGDEMRLQQGLAKLAGQEVGALGAASGVLAQRLAEPIAAYGKANTAVSSFADEAGKSAQTATVALGDKLAAGAQKGIDGILKLPGAAREAGSGLSTGLQQAVIRTNLEMAALPQRAGEAATALRTGLAAAAAETAEKVRQLPTAASAAADTLRTSIGGSATEAGAKLRDFGTAAADTGRSLGTSLQSGVTAAGTALRGLPAAATEAGQALGTSLRDGAVAAGQSLSTGLQTAVTRAKVELDALPQTAATAARAMGTGLLEGGRAAGTSLVDGLHSGLMGVGNALSTAASAARTGASAIGTAVGDGLKAIPAAVSSTFSTVGSAVNTGIGHLGRFTAAAAGAGASLGSTLGKGASSLVAFLGGPWGVAFAAAGVAVAGLGAVYEEFGSKAEQNAQKVVTGSQTLQQAIAAEQAQLEHNVLWWNSAAEKQRAYADVAADVTAKFREQYAAMTPMQKLTADVAIAQAKLNDLMAAGKGGTAEAAAAAAELATAQDKQKAATDGATQASKSYSEAMRDQVNAAQQLLGGLLAVEDALTREAEAQKAANEAVKAHGADSAAAKAALNDYSQSADSAAQAIAKLAGQQAEAQAAGSGAAAESRAYGAALVTMAANASGPAQAALKGHLGQLSQAKLDALSAGAAATGFGTKIMELPNGKTVKVAVDPETGKIVSTQQLLDAMSKNPVMIKIGADTVPADQAFQRVLTAVQQGQATVTIDGQEMPALDALANVGRQAGLANAIVNIGGNPVNGMAALEGFITSVKTGNPMVNIGGRDVDARVVFAALKDTVIGEKLIAALGLDPSSANATLAGFITSATAPITKPLGAEASSAMQTVRAVDVAGAAPVTKPMGGDPAGAMTANGSVNTAVQAPATKPIQGNPADANAKNAAVNSAVGTAATKPMNGNPADANAKNAALNKDIGITATKPISADKQPAQIIWDAFKNSITQNPISTTITTTIKRIFQTIGIPFANGGILPMAAGGVVAAQTRAYAAGGADEPGKTYDGHRLTAMSGNRAAIVQPKTYRVIGDNQRFPEVYIPLNGSQASLTYTGYAANQLGYALTPLTGGGEDDSETEAYGRGGHRRRNHRRRHHRRHHHRRHRRPGEPPATGPEPTTPPATTPPATGPAPSTPPATTPPATAPAGTYYTTSQVSTTQPLVRPAGAQPTGPISTTPGGAGGATIDLTALITEVQAVKAAVLATGPNNTDVVVAVGKVEKAIGGNQRGGHGYRAQCRRSDGELSRI